MTQLLNRAGPVCLTLMGSWLTVSATADSDAPGGNALQEITVLGQRTTTEIAREAQLQAPNLIDITTAAQMQRLPDVNTGITANVTATVWISALSRTPTTGGSCVTTIPATPRRYCAIGCRGTLTAHRTSIPTMRMHSSMGSLLPGRC